MNTGQSFLSVEGLTALSLVSLNFNSAVLTNTTTEVENKVYLTAFLLADDFFQEIKFINAELWIKSYEMVSGKYPSIYWELTNNLGDL